MQKVFDKNWKNKLPDRAGTEQTVEMQNRFEGEQKSIKPEGETDYNRETEKPEEKQLKPENKALEKPGIQIKKQTENRKREERPEGKRGKRILYSGWLKASAFVLQTISFVILVIYGVSIILYASVYNGETVKKGLDGKEYEDTQDFSENMVHTISDFENYLYCKEIFENEGSYDGDKQINVTAFSNQIREREGRTGWSEAEEGNTAATNQSSSGQLKIEEPEIEELSDNYEHFLQQQSKIEEAEMKGPPYKEMEEEITDGNSFSYYLQDLLDWAEAGIAHDEQGFLIERYRTVYGSSLEEALLEESGRRKIQEDLEETIRELDQWYFEYKEWKQTFEINPSNFKYLVFRADTKTIFSNILTEAENSISDVKSFGEWREQAKEMKSFGKYCFLNPERNEIVANFQINGRAYDRRREEAGEFHYMSYRRNLNDTLAGKAASLYYIAAAVDTSYPAADQFSEHHIEYKKLCAVLEGAALIGGIYAVVAFALFLYLTAAAGHKGSCQEIYLNWFDRIKTELAAGGMTITAVLLIYCFGFLIIRLEGYKEEILSLRYLLLWGSSAAVCNTAFLADYLSLVKRIKAKTVWRNSVLKYMLDWIRKKFVRPVLELWSNRKLVTKALIVYAGVLIIHVFVILFFWRVGTVLVFLMDLAIGGILLRETVERQKILEGIQKITEGDIEYQIALENLHGSNYKMGEAVNHIGEGLEQAIASSVKNERTKADLITNVSHDIKTPLTSIINYVDLLKRENIPDEKVKGYIQILDAKSQRLKQLTEDLVEASKVSSGNITLEMVRINFVELILQVLGEYEERFAEKNLELVVRLPKEPVIILADGRRVCRILDNLFRNIEKYALENTRVYAELTEEGLETVFSLKNISKFPLNIQAEELTERFIRGDISRSTEGSGLGLSIAKSLTLLQKGSFDLYVDGDLFKVILTFPVENGQESGK